MPGDDVRLGIIGRFGPIAGTAHVLLHHYMGDIDGAFRSWGLPGAHGLEAIAASARAHSRRSVSRRS
jgi:hypothetical protein